MKYEAHITVEPATGEGDVSFERFAEVVQQGGQWRASKFEHDDVDGMAGKWFMSYASDDRNNIFQVTQDTVAGLKDAGATVLRWKIEETLFDTKGNGALERMGKHEPADPAKPLKDMPINMVGDAAVSALENLGIKAPCIALVVVSTDTGEVAMTTNVASEEFPRDVAMYILENHVAGSYTMHRSDFN